MLKYLFAALLITFALPLRMSAADPADTPTVNAHGAILMDAETGRVLWGKDAHAPLAMASTTKIMTAVLALESGRLDETVTVSRRAAAAPKVKLYLSAGEKIRLGDLLYALMLESSNDAAVAIAEHLSGDVQVFCEEMTRKARALGALDTVFETPNGLDAGMHHSTPYDLAVITRYALDVEGFQALVNTPSAHISSDRRAYALHNRNRLLHEYPGANGVKTGFTNKAGHCFVGAAKRSIRGEDMQLIAVVLASGWGDRGRNQKFADSKEILSYGFANYAYEVILTAHENAGTLPVTRSRTDAVALAYAEGIRVPLHKDETAYVALYVPESFKAPIAEGDMLGSARVYIGGDFYAEVPLTATDAAARHDFKTSLEKILHAFTAQLTNNSVEIVLPEWE